MLTAALPLLSAVSLLASPNDFPAELCVRWTQALKQVKGPDGAVIPHDQVHRTHLGSLNGFLAEVKRSDEVIGT